MKLLRIIAIIGIMVVMSGCGQVEMIFQCADNVNEGLLLPIDIILVSQQEEKNVVMIGPEAWFESEYRNAMPKEQIIKQALKGGETREMVFKPGQKKKDSVIIIFADYMNKTEQEAQQIILYPKQCRKGVRVRVEEKGLVVEK